jgi:adenylate cyclase
MGNLETQIYEFGPFRLHLAKQCLLRDGRTVHLKPKVFDLLVALVQHSGELLTKDALMRQLWPDSFVEENNLAVSIFALRKALGERHGEHLYVKTIPRRGYIFVGDVKDLALEGVADHHASNGSHAPGNGQRPVNPEAYQAYMRGRFFCNKKTAESLKKAISYFERTLKLDPHFALAYAGLAEAYMHMFHTNVLPCKGAYLIAQKYLSQALEIDNDLTEARATLGLLKVCNGWDWNGAEEEFRRALQLNPRYPVGHQLFAICLRHKGRFDEALDEINKAQELDPVSPTISTTKAGIFYYSRQYEQAARELERALELDMNYPIAHYFAGLTYAQMGRYDEAILEFQTVSDIVGFDSPEYRSSLAYVYATIGAIEKARELLNDLIECSKKEYIPPFHIAIVWTGLGEVDKAFAFLEKSYEDQDPELCVLRVDPRLDGLHPDPRYADLLQRIGLLPPNSSTEITPT